MAQSAVTIVDEMEAIVAWLRGMFPEIPKDHFGFQEVPEQPPADSFYIRFQNDNRVAETPFVMVAHREYQIIHFNTVPDIFARMDSLSRKCLYGRMLIPVNEASKRYIRIDAFSFGNVLDTENSDDLKAIVGVLAVEVREARDQESYEKIKQIFTRYTINIPMGG